jgi:hypothetical protein
MWTAGTAHKRPGDTSTWLHNLLLLVRASSFRERGWLKARPRRSVWGASFLRKWALAPCRSSRAIKYPAVCRVWSTLSLDVATVLSVSFLSVLWLSVRLCRAVRVRPRVSCGLSFVGTGPVKYLVRLRLRVRRREVPCAARAAAHPPTGPHSALRSAGAAHARAHRPAPPQRATGLGHARVMLWRGCRSVRPCIYQYE